jgi:glutaminyl-peptide cyclotransferase
MALQLRPLKFRALALIAGAASLGLISVACGSNSPEAASNAPATPPAASATTPAAPQASQLPPVKDPGVDGFSGQRAFDQVKKQVDFGPRPPGSDAIHKLQDYLLAELKSYGCQIDTDDFHAQTPNGNIAMKNIVAKIPGKSSNVILLATHYDTDTIDQQDNKMTNFVGADDAGSSTGVMLEIARVLCGKPQPATIWIAFFDGEEAMKHWDNDSDGTYGSREMAAKFAASGELLKIKAMVLADLIGNKDLKVRRDASAPDWMNDIAWNNAAKLGYQSVFLSDRFSYEDDHQPFMHRNVPALDLIDCCGENVPYWHTPGDTLDKLSPVSLQIIGDVILTSLPDIARHIH